HRARHLALERLLQRGRWSPVDLLARDVYRRRGRVTALERRRLARHHDRLELERILREGHHNVRLAGLHEHFLLLVADRADQESNVARRDRDAERAVGRRLGDAWAAEFADRRQAHRYPADRACHAARDVATLGTGRHRGQAERNDGCRKHCVLAHALSPCVRMNAAGGVPPGTETSEGPAALHEQGRETLIPGSEERRTPGKRHVTAVPMSLTLKGAGICRRYAAPATTTVCGGEPRASSRSGSPRSRCPGADI